MKTVVVTGAAKSGTTMTAGVCQLLGFDMIYQPGEWEDYIEDLELIKALSENKSIEPLIKERNEFEMWGIKHPDLFSKPSLIDKLMPHLTDPHLIVIWRDIAAITENRVKGLNSTHRRELQEANEILQDQFNFLNWYSSNFNIKAKFYSYEKALLAPARFGYEMAKFLGVTPEEEFLQNCDNFISAGRPYQNLDIAL